MISLTPSFSLYLYRWLIYEEAGFQGIPFILEPGEYPDLSFWNTQEAYIGSVRPLKMVILFFQELQKQKPFAGLMRKKLANYNYFSC